LGAKGMDVGMCWCDVNFGYFGDLARFYDLVVCGVKNENYDF